VCSSCRRGGGVGRATLLVHYSLWLLQNGGHLCSLLLCLQAAGGLLAARARGCSTNKRQEGQPGSATACAAANIAEPEGNLSKDACAFFQALERLVPET